jgi:hypothetical protein
VLLRDLLHALRGQPGSVGYVAERLARGSRRKDRFAQLAPCLLDLRGSSFDAP